MKSCVAVITLGPFTAGEIPAPLQYQFLDADGNPIDLTGFTVQFTYGPVDGVVATGTASVVNPALGIVQHIWTGAELSTPGRYRARFWVGNLTNRWASTRIEYTVSYGGPAPAI